MISSERQSRHQVDLHVSDIITVDSINSLHGGPETLGFFLARAGGGGGEV